MSMEHKTCAECRFFDRYRPTGDHGQCRRRAPVAFVDEYGPAECRTRTIEGAFPSVLSDWWCGEFEAREEPAPEEPR
jgi:hypothetical protein